MQSYMLRVLNEAFWSVLFPECLATVCVSDYYVVVSRGASLSLLTH